jgi:hypothetical protein
VGSVSPTTTVALSGVSASGSVGDVTFVQVAPLTGTQAAGSVGSAGPNITVALSGVSATGSTGIVFPVYWKLIDDSQTADWQNISDTQNSGWVLVDDSQTANWQNVADAQPSSWVLVDDSETADWELIETA